MKKLLMIIGVAAVSVMIWLGLSSSKAPDVPPETQQILFEKAVAMIKKYETLHQPRHWPLVGYGHMVLPGEKFSRSKAMSEAEADALLRKDLLKNCAVFRDYGADSLLLGVLAYNIGSGNVKKSSVAKMLREGNRDIYANYISHSRYRGRQHAGLRKRRIEEFEQLFVTDSLIKSLAPSAAPQEITIDSVTAEKDIVMITHNQPSNSETNEYK